MARMTRTQVSLEDEEYRFLKAQAAQSGSSLSSVVRQLVRDHMSLASTRAPHVWEIAGLIDASDFTGRDHDTVLNDGQTGPSAGARTGCPA